MCIFYILFCSFRFSKGQICYQIIFNLKFCNEKDYQIISFKKSLNFIRNIKFNFIGFILTFHLRFIKKSFLFIPHHHLKMMVILMDLIKVLDKLKIKYFIMSGTLLGAIRQSSFAGKPGDIDLAINISDLDKLNLYLNEK